MNTLYMIGNTHFDPVWLWTWDEAMASIRATFRAALDRMDEDPDFVYSFSTPAVFEWIERVDPGLFESIRARVREGRWDVAAEGWWLQPDCNTPSGESLIRQGLYGQRYLIEKFGVQATTVFNIDSFGHSAMLPQILRKSGLKYYVFSRPGRDELALQDELFDWRAPDGSTVTVYRSGSSDAAGSYPQDISAAIEGWRDVLEAWPHDAAQVYGVSDHGGAPTKKAIVDIRQAMDHPDRVNVRFGSTTAFFDAQSDKPRPVYQGELASRAYGPFSNRTHIKRGNRQGEYALLHAERAALMAGWTVGRPYPDETLRRGWKDLLFNQFHDILGGTCIPQAYDDARDLMGRLRQNAAEEKHFALQSLCRDIRMIGNNETEVWNICLFNLNDTPYRGVVEADAQWIWEFPWYSDGIELIDETGAAHPAQIVTEKCLIPGFRSRFAFRADVPAMGWRVYAVRKTGLPAARWDPAADVISPFVFRAFEDEGDTWCFNTPQGYGRECEAPVLIDRRVCESGPLFTTVRQRWTFRRSLLEEYITEYRNSDEVDYRYVVNWNEGHTVLKLIPRDVPAQPVTSAIPAGAIEREADGHEYPLGEWIRWGHGETGVTLLLDGVFAYDTHDSIRLTILRSPYYGDLRIGALDDREVRPFMEQGVHEGRIRVIPRALTNSQAAALAAHWNAPPVIVCEANHEGKLPSTHSLMSIEGSVALSALKKAEDGDDVILRLTEMNGERTDAAVTLNTWRAALTFAPYEIKTLRVSREGRWREVDMLER